MLDLVLAIAHHLLVFALAGILVAEAMLVFRAVGESDVRRLAAVDAFYGATAGLILLVGAARVIWSVKGPDFYVENPFFWAKIGCFAVVGVLSILPSLRFLLWRRRLLSDGSLPVAGELATVRRVVVAELIVFALIPALAATMARGYGL